MTIALEAKQRLHAAAEETHVKQLVALIKRTLATYTFVTSDGKKVKGATVADVKDVLKSDALFRKVTPGLTLQLLLRKEGLNVITLHGKRDGRGKEIEFWTVKVLT